MTKGERIKKILSATVTGFLILCTTVCLILVIKVVFGKDPTILGYRTFYIVTGSMEPDIPIGAVVITKKQPSYEVGDTITFKSESAEIKGMPNTHNIIDVLDINGKTYYQTKGVANSKPDPDLVPINNVYGKVVVHTGKADWVGNALAFLTQPQGFMVVIVVPILLLAVIAMKDYLKALKAEINKNAKLPEEAENSPEEKDESEVEQ